MKQLFKTTVFLILFAFGKLLFAQEFGNANLKLGLYSEERIRCFVKAQEEQLSFFLSENEGKYFSSFRGWSKIELSANKLKELSFKPWCSSIRIEGGRGVALEDTSKVNTRTIRVHRGEIPRHPAYTGNGVLMGFIDTGIDFTHPDFQNRDGSTRILKIWDQTAPDDSVLTPPKFEYGVVYDSAMINGGLCPHLDPDGHGTQVSSIGAGNGFSVPLSIADYSGHAPESNILFVATSFSRRNWTMSVAEGVEWIFSEADKLGLPCVINLSVGTYLGSHDGKDLASQLIDSLITAKEGRFVVCAAGNSGNLSPYHLRTQVNSDTSFTYFKPNVNSNFGNSVYFEGWSDTADFKNLELGFGYTQETTWKDSVLLFESSLDLIDTSFVIPFGGNSTLYTYAEIQESRVFFQFFLTNPKPKQLYGLVTVGTGMHDIWSAAALGSSDIVTDNLPSVTLYPLITKYTYPDSLQSIVSSWNCSPNVVSVANYNNRYSYLNQYDSMRITVDFPIGGKGPTSSIGPTRTSYTKPDIGAPGNFSLAAGRFQDLNALKSIPAVGYRLAKGGYHFSNGGTSMASPTVAGIAALYFEKCPKADAKEVRRALLDNAFTDVHTGTVPNNVFGAGKVDAFAALSSSNRYDTLSASGSHVICLGDSIEVSFHTNEPSFLWNDGVQQSTRFVKDSDTLFVQYENASGCKEHSDTIVTKRVSLPNVRIISASDSLCFDTEMTLYASGAKNYEWNNGLAADSMNIGQAGMYILVGTDSNGCKRRDTISVIGYNCTVGLGELPEVEFKVYPMPFSENLHINWNPENFKVLNLRFMDANGKPVPLKNVYSVDNLNGSAEINTNHLARGTYLLEVSSNEQSNYLRVVKN